MRHNEIFKKKLFVPFFKMAAGLHDEEIRKTEKILSFSEDLNIGKIAGLIAL